MVKLEQILGILGSMVLNDVLLCPIYVLREYHFFFSEVERYFSREVKIRR
jgi:hypothetical protein